MGNRCTRGSTVAQNRPAPIDPLDSQHGASSIHGHGSNSSVHVREDPLSMIPDTCDVSDDIQLGDLLGRGSFGNVYKGTVVATGEVVAVKILDRRKIKASSIHREWNVLQHLGHHEMIVDYKRCYKTAQKVAFVFEMMDSGELFDRLVKQGPYNELEAKCYFKGVAAGLAYLHARGIVHRDVKPENILITRTSTCGRVRPPTVTASSTSAEDKLNQRGSAGSALAPPSGPEPATSPWQSTAPKRLHGVAPPSTRTSTGNYQNGFTVSVNWSAGEGNTINQVQSPYTLKIADFGLSQILGPNERLLKICGTWAYAAPEMSSQDRTGYDCKFDCYGLGIVLYVALSGYHPFDPTGTLPVAEIKMRARSAMYDFASPEWRHVSPIAKDLISRLIVKDPEYRLDAASALKHRWFQDLGILPLFMQLAPSRFGSVSAASGSSAALVKRAQAGRDTPGSEQQPAPTAAAAISATAAAPVAPVVKLPHGEQPDSQVDGSSLPRRPLHHAAAAASSPMVPLLQVADTANWPASADLGPSQLTKEENGDVTQEQQLLAERPPEQQQQQEQEEEQGVHPDRAPVDVTEDAAAAHAVSGAAGAHRKFSRLTARDASSTTLDTTAAAAAGGNGGKPAVADSRATTSILTTTTTTGGRTQYRSVALPVSPIQPRGSFTANRPAELRVLALQNLSGLRSPALRPSLQQGNGGSNGSGSHSARGSLGTPPRPHRSTTTASATAPMLTARSHTRTISMVSAMGVDTPGRGLYEASPGGATPPAASGGFPVGTPTARTTATPTAATASCMVRVGTARVLVRASSEDCAIGSAASSAPGARISRNTPSRAPSTASALNRTRSVSVDVGGALGAWPAEGSSQEGTAGFTAHSHVGSGGEPVLLTPLSGSNVARKATGSTAGPMDHTSGGPGGS